jgi:glycosyltransferase involved in cell wall biosynthesis
VRFHIVSLPHTQTTKEWSWCAYTEKVRKFANMMTDIGHDVFLYSGEENEARCAEHITVITKAEQEEWFGHLNWETDLFPSGGWEPTKTWWTVMNARAVAEIAKREEPGDILGLTMGRSQEALAQAFPQMLPCEWGVGYEGVITPYRVWESYAHMHYVHGTQKDTTGRNYDAVIPNSFEVEDFPLGKGDGGYYLYLGRVILRKGPHIAGEVCSHLDEPLILAGQGVWKQEPGEIYGVDKVVIRHNDPTKLSWAGVVGPKERADLLGGAKALFVPTIYIEPFGGVAIEAMLCGTPVLTSDYGAFTETVHPGINGYRCRTFQEWVDAAKMAPLLPRERVRESAMRYSTENVATEYDYFFRRLDSLRRDGWYTMGDL